MMDRWRSEFLHYEFNKCVLCNSNLMYRVKFGPSSNICDRCRRIERKYNVMPFQELNKQKIVKPLFLCRYKPQGCTKIISLQQISNHENKCNFRQLFCPLLPPRNCSWQGTPDESQSHFTTEHPKLFSDSGTFELNFAENYKKNILMPVNDNLFVIHTEYSQEDDKFYCSVYQLKHFSNKLYKYSIEFRTKDGQNNYQLNSNAVSMYIVDMPEEQGYSIDISILNEHLQYPKYITYDVKIIEEEINSSTEASIDEVDITSMPSYDIFENIKCPVCLEYMTPPIYQCREGHNVCEICTPKLDNCPYCSENLQDMRNFELEKIVENLMYKCNNHVNGCTHLASSKNIRQHESECKFMTKQCPFNVYDHCRWKGICNNIVSHVSVNHPKLILSDEPFVLNLRHAYNEDNDECERLAEKFGQLFRLNLEYTNVKRKIYATVQFIGTTEEPEKYMYKVEVFDFSNQKLGCCSKKCCGSINDDRHDDKHCSIWTLDMLFPFMSVNKDIKMIFKIMEAE